MTTVAGTVQGFFTDRLIRQRRCSPHTIASYRDSLRMLILFACERHRTTPSSLEFTDLDVATVSAFLDHLEQRRGCGISTRNTRLAAIHSLFAHAATVHPEHAGDIARVLAIPAKRTEQRLITYLTEPEADALLCATDQATRTGRRDHALLLLALQTGLRASELTMLTPADVHLGTGAHVSCHGKGRKDRITPLTRPTSDTLRAWLTECAPGAVDPVFPTLRGTRMSSDALGQRVARHASAAVSACPSLQAKHVTPHVLRHTAAMRLLHAGVEITVIALWLGHENVNTTYAYLKADLELKQQALDRTTPPGGSLGRYQPSDQLLTFLNGL